MNFVFLFTYCSLLKVAVCNSSFTEAAEVLPNALKFTLGTLGVTVGSLLQIDLSPTVNFFDPDYNRSLSELITSMGYPVEQYNVTTEDGYILGLFRVPYGKGNKEEIGKKPILLIHGIAGSGWNYAINYYPYQNLACILADAGYDVFLGNLRGTLYSQKHVNLSTEDSEYWNFNFDEMGLYDLPAMIDFILITTEHAQLTYLAHSMGTTSILVLLSTRTEYNDKINFVCCMSPVAKMEHTTAPILQLYQASDVVSELASITGVSGIMPATALEQSFKSRFICGVSILSTLCRFTDQIIGGLDSGHLNETRLPVYIHHGNSGSSIYVMIHFSQIKARNEFAMYDYGTEENQKKYGQDTPPVYDVSRITAKMAFYSSRTDALADQQDIDFLRRSIPNIVQDIIVEPDYAHIDFLWAEDAYKYVYDQVLQDINNYNN